MVNDMPELVAKLRELEIEEDASTWHLVRTRYVEAGRLWKSLKDAGQIKAAGGAETFVAEHGLKSRQYYWLCEFCYKERTRIREHEEWWNQQNHKPNLKKDNSGPGFYMAVFKAKANRPPKQTKTRDTKDLAAKIALLTDQRNRAVVIAKRLANQRPDPAMPPELTALEKEIEREDAGEFAGSPIRPVTSNVKAPLQQMTVEEARHRIAATKDLPVEKMALELQIINREMTERGCPAFLLDLAIEILAPDDEAPPYKFEGGNSPIRWCNDLKFVIIVTHDYPTEVLLLPTTDETPPPDPTISIFGHRFQVTGPSPPQKPPRQSKRKAKP